MGGLTDDLSRAFELHRCGKLSGAAEVCRQILQRDSTHAAAWHLAGLIAHQVGRHSEAVRHITRALELDPENPEFWNNLAAVCLAMGSPETAEQCSTQAIKRRPDFAEAHNHLGTALRSAGRVQQSVSAYERALELRPDTAPFHANIAGAYQELGKLDRALHHYEEALRLNPNDSHTYFNLSDWVQRGKYRFTPPQLARIDNLLRSNELPPQAAIPLCFAAARTLNGAGDCEAAFAMLARGNALRAELLAQNSIRFDSKQHAGYVSRIIRTFDASYFAHRTHDGASSELPIFIVGMPRSGTTLVEQILSSHPTVFGAGELDAIPHLVRTIAEQTSLQEQYPECLIEADSSKLLPIAQLHVDALQRMAPDAMRITDKLPGNFIHLGFIATLLPRARIVHCRRDPLDVCLSCFAQNFAADETAAFCCSLESLAAYYREYERIMRHWATVLPLRTFELNYEDLVQSPERVIRQLVDFSGLPWDDHCLEFHTTRRTVRTASSLQVREPIYDSSIGRWKRYARQLESLRQAIQQPV